MIEWALNTLLDTVPIVFCLGMLWRGLEGCCGVDSTPRDRHDRRAR